MSIQQLPAAISYGHPLRPLRVDFNKRTGHFTMDTNHYHPAYEIYYLFSGERNYFIKDRTYPVHPGDLVLIDTAAVHKTSPSDTGAQDHERAVLYFEPAYFDAFPTEERELLLSAFKERYPLLRLNLQERLQVEELLRSMLIEIHEQPPGYELHVRHMAGELLLFAARQTLKREVVPDDDPSPVQKKMTDIVRHINVHYGEPLDLDALSQQFYISRSHLSRVFKEVTGFSFTEYVTTTRVKEAERLLRETDTGITRISELTGFENFSHFGKVFKKLTGQSPRDYRKSSK